MMKNIKSLTLTVFSLCTAICMQAQVETKKMAERPIPQSSIPPVQAPDMLNAPKPVANTEPVAETPSPLARDKNMKPAETEKPNFQVVEYKEPETPGGAEGKKIMAGKTTRPAPVINNQSTIDHTLVPQPVKPLKPVNGQQQQ